VLLHATIARERALIAYHHQVETIVPGLAITRVGPEAAVVFPVPGRPRVRTLPAGTDVFGELEAATAPQPEGAGQSPGAVGAAAPPTPTVVSQQQLGGYQVTVLKGGSGQTLFAWLSSHQYHLPAGSQPILTHYISGRWYFVAIRLADRRAGEIEPLAIAFHSRLIAYPMLLSRVATDPINVELFVNASGPVSARGIDGFTTVFQGRVSSLKPPPSSAVTALLPAAYLTRLESHSLAPATISRDVILVAGSTSPARDNSGHALPIAVGATATAALLLGLGYIVLKRRRVR
jgi:hypothetical protein